ncbi:MAG: chemotaxis protein CheW [Dyella sp.]|nr:chemotaxis protein CheW [Dyella sp.]MBV8270656.1 chemotaxis protein CheW [Cupriavidus sp.]
MMIGSSESGAAMEFLAFALGKEEYGIDILKVQEIRSYETPTQIANAPAHLKGVINLRGRIVPIVDLRIRFNHVTVRYDQQTVVIIIDLGQQTVGMVVDGVSDVQMLAPSQIKPAPRLTDDVSTDYIIGIGSAEQRMIILVDVEKLLNSAELVTIEAQD